MKLIKNKAGCVDCYMTSTPSFRRQKQEDVCELINEKPDLHRELQDSQKCIGRPVLERSKDTDKKILKHSIAIRLMHIKITLRILTFSEMLKNMQSTIVHAGDHAGKNDRLFISAGSKKWYNHLHLSNLKLLPAQQNYPTLINIEALLANLPWWSAGTPIFTRVMLLYKTPVPGTHLNIFSISPLPVGSLMGDVNCPWCYLLQIRTRGSCWRCPLCYLPTSRLGVHLPLSAKACVNYPPVLEGWGVRTLTSVNFHCGCCWFISLLPMKDK